MKFSTSLIVSAFLFGALFMSSGCNKKKDTIAKVYVYDTDKNPILGAEVILYAQGTEGTSFGKTLIQPDTVITNISGEAIFNLSELYQLGQSGVAVLNIDASKDGLKGEGVIQVVEEETAEANVYIK